MCIRDRSKTVLEAVRTSINPRVIDCPNPSSGQTRQMCIRDRAMAEAFRNGNLGVLDYARYQTVVADTKMRDSIAKPDAAPSSIK